MGGSLGLTFVSRSFIVCERVKLAFALTLYGGLLTLLSQPLGALVIFSRAWRPTQTAHLSVSLYQVSDITPEGRCFIGASRYPDEHPSTAPAYSTHLGPYHSNRLQ